MGTSGTPSLQDPVGDCVDITGGSSFPVALSPASTLLRAATTTVGGRGSAEVTTEGGQTITMYFTDGAQAPCRIVSVVSITGIEQLEAWS